MKTWLKMIVVAAAFGLGAPAMAQSGAQNGAAPAAPAPAAAPATPAAAPATNAAAPAAPAAGNAAAAARPTYTSPVAVDPTMGMPDGRMLMQDQVTPIGHEAAWFHNYILLPMTFVISIFVLGLMGWVVIRYNKRANPTPSRTTHNTMIEVIWTLVPVLILVVIAIPSIRLLANQYSPPAADLTIKVTGNQWYWTYEYPDHGINITSNMLREAGNPDLGPAGRPRTDADGPRLLAVDNRIVVPVNATVKLIVTSADVIHAFAVPAFWVKIDAVPGRLNETWFRAERTGVYFGQCSELCGAQHGFMPIAVEVVSQADFQRWVASQGGHMPTAGGGTGNASATAPAPAAPSTNAAAPAAANDNSAAALSSPVPSTNAAANR